MDVIATALFLALILGTLILIRMCERLGVSE